LKRITIDTKTKITYKLEEDPSSWLATDGGSVCMCRINRMYVCAEIELNKVPKDRIWSWIPGSH
jgi:hypothetical protein